MFSVVGNVHLQSEFAQCRGALSFSRDLTSFLLLLLELSGSIEVSGGERVELDCRCFGVHVAANYLSADLPTMTKQFDLHSLCQSFERLYISNDLDVVFRFSHKLREIFVFLNGPLLHCFVCEAGLQLEGSYLGSVIRYDRESLLVIIVQEFTCEYIVSNKISLKSDNGARAY